MDRKSESKSRTHLVIQTAFLGDLLLTIPLLRYLKEEFPKDQLAVVCRKGLASVLQDFALADVIYEVDKNDSADRTQVLKKLKSQRFGFLFCAHRSVRTRLWAAQIDAEKKIGYRDFYFNWLGNWPFDEAIERPMHLPETLRLFALVQSLDPEIKKYLKNAKREDPVPAWAAMNVPKYSDNHLLGHRLQKDGRINQRTEFRTDKNAQARAQAVAIAPGSVWETKRWPIEHYAEVVRFYLQQNREVFLVGSPEEQNLGEYIRQVIHDVEPKLEHHLFDQIGKLSIPKTTELISLCDLAISNDSGAMHMASVAGTPTVAIFGPTVLGLGYQPWQNRALVVETDLACRPCGLHGGRRCPLGHHHCMKLVSVDQVLSAGSRLET